MMKPNWLLWIWNHKKQPATKYRSHTQGISCSEIYLLLKRQTHLLLLDMMRMKVNLAILSLKLLWMVRMKLKTINSKKAIKNK